MRDFVHKISTFFDLNTVLESYNLKIVLLLAVGFAAASLLGYFAFKLKVSPILGYLLAGYLIGPYSPGFVADMHISEQLAEIGVILMLFGVGLDFKVQDLLKVKKIAILGGVGQTFFSAMITAIVVHLFGWNLNTGVIIGLAIGVASTVVLVRILAENNLLTTKEGHIAVGWLIVEDIITVVILLLLPTFSRVTTGGEVSFKELALSISFVAFKFALLTFILLTVGKKAVSFVLSKVMHTHSHELFTLSVLALVFLIAIATTFFFGISIALGAFIAGVVVRQTKVHHKALIHSLPMKDAFIAIFFLSVGMLFNPAIIFKKFYLFLSILLIILLIKPLVAYLITRALKYTNRVAIIIAVALAQIGEFSFILSEESMKFGFMPDEGYDIIVACALLSIAINPLIFKLIYKKRNTITNSSR